MATSLTCDSDPSHGYADVLVSRLADGTTLAWCDACFLAMCKAVAESATQAEVDETDADALARLGADADPASFPTQPASSDVADRAAELPTQPDSAAAESVPTVNGATPAETPPEPTLAARNRGSRTG